MEQKKTFIIAGDAPVLSKDTLDLFKSFDLGIDGVFAYQREKVTITLKEGVERTDEHCAAVLKTAYTDAGWRNLIIARMPGE